MFENNITICFVMFEILNASPNLSHHASYIFQVVKTCVMY